MEGVGAGKGSGSIKKMYVVGVENGRKSCTKTGRRRYIRSDTAEGARVLFRQSLNEAKDDLIS